MRLLAVVLLLATNVVAECPRDPKSKEGLLAVENRWVAALNVKDSQALGCILGMEFTDSGVQGELRDRSKVLSDLPRRRDAGQRLDELEAVLLGNAGLVRGVNHLTMPDGKPLVDVRFTDVFVYRDGRWQAVSAQETLVKKRRRSWNSRLHRKS